MSTRPPDAILHHFRYEPGTGAFIRTRGTLAWHPVEVRVDSPAPRGYRRVRFLNRLYQAHRLAWFFVYDEWPSGMIDHINGDRSDNRIANLRIATRRQNAWNKRPQGRIASKGVYFCKGKFVSRICINGQLHRLGTFKSEAEAAHAYDVAAEAAFGEFALTNKSLSEAA